MRVRDARILGFFTGLYMSYTTFPLMDPFKLFNTLIAVISIFVGVKIIKGVPGGLLSGVGVGIALGSILMLSIG